MQWHETTGKGFKRKAQNGEYLVTEANPKRGNKFKRMQLQIPKYILSYIVK